MVVFANQHSRQVGGGPGMSLPITWGKLDQTGYSKLKFSVDITTQSNNSLMWIQNVSL